MLRAPTTARTPFKTCARLRILHVADRFQQHERVTQACLGAANATERDTLINWATGSGRRRRTGQRCDGDDQPGRCAGPRSTATSCTRARSRSTWARTPRPRSWCSTAATTACCAPSTATARTERAADRQRCRRQRDVGVHGAGVLRAHQAAARQYDSDQFLRQHVHLAGTAAQALRHRRTAHLLQERKQPVVVRGDAPGRTDDLCFRCLDDPHQPVEPDPQVADRLPQHGQQHGLHDWLR